MQGEKAEQSIINALEKCIRHRENFDAVVIIRGGGSVADLHCFDSYPMGQMIALSPLPVFTGIGHERDETVADHVANRRLITPTAVAEFLITRATEFEDTIDDLKHRIIARARDFIESEKRSLSASADSFLASARAYLKTAKVALRENIREIQTKALTALKAPSISIKGYEGNLRNAGEGLIRNNRQKLREFIKVLSVHPAHLVSMQTQKMETYDTRLRLLDPQNVLNRGYSITYFNGKALKNAGAAKKDDIITTRLSNGSLISIVEKVEEEKTDE
jgi:exodeoxyribonuclease VII large subunit